MVVAAGGADEVAAFVHTHGTRLVRMAHLLDVANPVAAAAEAMASALHEHRGGDAHAHLADAARHVGSRARPPVREEARLQGWLDRAETVAYDANVDRLRQETARTLEALSVRRRRSRRRLAAGGVAALLLVAGASFVTGEDDDTAALPPPDGLGRLRETGRPPDSELVGLPPAGSFSLPRQLQSANGVIVADVLLQGPAIPIARVDIATGSATMLAVEGMTREGARVVCVLAIPDARSMLQADESDLVGVVPAPRHGRLLASGSPLTVRQVVVEDYRGRNLTFDVTSSQVDNALVTFADGRRTLANRYSTAGSDLALFVTVDDTAAARIAYLDHRRGELRSRSLYTATP